MRKSQHFTKNGTGPAADGSSFRAGKEKWRGPIFRRLMPGLPVYLLFRKVNPRALVKHPAQSPPQAKLHTEPCALLQYKPFLPIVHRLTAARRYNQSRHRSFA
jgi:hypothetical protein